MAARKSAPRKDYMPNVDPKYARSNRVQSEPRPSTPNTARMLLSPGVGKTGTETRWVPTEADKAYARKSHYEGESIRVGARGFTKLGQQSGAARHNKNERAVDATKTRVTKVGKPVKRGNMVMQKMTVTGGSRSAAAPKTSYKKAAKKK